MKDIDLVPYDQDQNYEFIKELYKMNGISPFAKEFLPTCGYIAFDKSLLIAAGFLLCTDTNLCFIEYFVSNPTVDWKIRNDAIIMIVEALLEDAKTFGFKVACANFKNKRLAEKASKLGFRVDSQQYFLASRSI